MCILNEKTRAELASLLLQRFHSTGAQNGTFGPDCRFPEGKRRFGNPSWGRLRVDMGHLVVNTWANLSQHVLALDRLESVGLVLGPFWLGFWCI